MSGIVIVGSGLGGWTVAREFRKLDKDTPVTLVTADGGEVYSKPMLSNAIAKGQDRGALVQKTAERAAEEFGVTVLAHARVKRIHRADESLEIERDGETTALPYASLVLALGADPRAYAPEGARSVPIHTVNDLDGYAAWRERLEPGHRVLLVGAGLIGCEFADDLRQGGMDVTVVDPALWPLGRLLPEALGHLLASALRENGVTLKLGRMINRVEPGRAQGGLAHVDGGEVIEFDHALSAIGLAPRVRLAEAAGLEVDGGIKVDRHLRSSDPAIYALGDCAATEAGPLPFVLPLMAEARAIAATLAGNETALKLPALPVVVKTPSLPLVVCPPRPGTKGSWAVEGDGRDRAAFFSDPEGNRLGFALSGSETARRMALGKEMPPILG